VCAFNLVATRGDELNAWADGANITVTSAMLRFLDDGDDLAVVVAHEIAHNALRHVQAEQKNVSTGSQPSAIGDSAAAQGGNATASSRRQERMSARRCTPRTSRARRTT
jgi:predicted Zn-dependent protease